MISASVLVNSTKETIVETLWNSDSAIHELLGRALDLSNARDMLFSYLESLERQYYNVYSPRFSTSHHVIERNSAKECIRVLKNVFRTENEVLTGFSPLRTLMQIAQNKEGILEKTDKGFLCEFVYLFRGINGNTGIATLDSNKTGVSETEEAQVRSLALDEYSDRMISSFKRFKSGTDSVISRSRMELRHKILTHFGASESDWGDYRWHLNHIVRSTDELASLVKLEKDELEGFREAQRANIPIHITPYYVSLFSEQGRTSHDRVIRKQVIPSVNYCRTVAKSRSEGRDNDFMGEKHTSPIECITRRYPQIVILKPFDSCPQICVYCQRNWEITDIDHGSVSKDKVDAAIDWIKNNKSITEVLVTGGDPLTLSTERLDEILGKIAAIKRIERIRIGTRTLVTIPMRINQELVDVLSKYHVWGQREVSIVTHVEHPCELTDEVLDAVKLIKSAGMNIYNQQVFTYYNSRRYESAFLRKKLKLSGIDPYYSFNTKGKEETADFRVPIPRIEQERKEEARLLPGLVRTDEPVFNVPKLGKSHLRAWQDHEPIMILPDGRRIYRFYPWESKIALADDYLYTDVAIYDYLQRLSSEGEDIDDYESVWYYF
ncbi:MAG: KamA family radical SAM protein [Chitinispirillaceae bacterium]